MATCTILETMKNEATVLPTEIQKDLITAFAKFGLTISTQDVDLILKKGADWFFLQKGVSIGENEIVEIYVIMNCINEMR